jgi:hypothetical protein
MDMTNTSATSEDRSKHGKEVVMPVDNKRDMMWILLVLGVIALGLIFFFVGPQIAG